MKTHGNSTKTIKEMDGSQTKNEEKKEECLHCGISLKNFVDYPYAPCIPTNQNHEFPAPQVDKNQSKECKHNQIESNMCAEFCRECGEVLRDDTQSEYATLEIQKLVGEQINRNYSWNLSQSNTMEEVRKEFYKSFKDFKELTTIDSICIADWWLEKLSQVRKETIRACVEKVRDVFGYEDVINLLSEDIEQ